MKSAQENNLVSIVLSAYNGSKYLKEQLECILRQSYKHIEIILIDDKSTDGTLAIARSIANTDKRIKVCENQKNIGVVASFLKGLSYANGEFIAFCDQDDYWHPDKIKILTDLLSKNKENMLAYSDLEVCNENMQTMYSSFWELTGVKPKSGHLREIVFLKNLAPGCSMLFRREVREVLLKIFPDAPFMHDHLALIAGSGLGNIVYTNKALVKYRQHAANNIGAFYNSIITKEKISREIKEKVNYFKQLPFAGELDLDMQRLEGFCDLLVKNNARNRAAFLDYYIFLRNDTLTGKGLAVLDCLFPSAYDFLHRFSKTFGEHFYGGVKNTVFAIWAFVCLWFFVKDFVIYKLTKVLAWLKI